MRHQCLELDYIIDNTLCKQDKIARLRAVAMVNRTIKPGVPQVDAK